MGGWGFGFLVGFFGCFLIQNCFHLSNQNLPSISYPEHPDPEQVPIKLIPRCFQMLLEVILLLPAPLGENLSRIWPQSWPQMIQ